MINTKRLCQFTEECSKCSCQPFCVSATKITYGKRRFMFSLRNEPIISKELQAKFDGGTKRHQEYQQDIKTIEEYGFLNFRKDLHTHSPIKLKEVKVCSPRFGLHGVIDILSIRYDKGNIHIFIDELKSNFSKTNYIQLSVYARILSDMHCNISYEEPFKRKKKVHRLVCPLYPSATKYININGRVHVFNTPENGYWQMVALNQYFVGAGDIALYISKKLKEYQNLMKQKVIDACMVDYCNGCSSEFRVSSCGWRELCSRYPFTPKTRQFHLGRKKTVVRNKPTRIVRRL